MRGIRSLTAAAVIAAALVLAAPAAGATIKSNMVHAFGFKVGCGVQLKTLGGGISCTSEALPSTELDGFVELHATGEPTLGERGDSPYRPNSKNKKLRRGDRWSRVGVTCVLHASLRCENADGHGFTLTPKAYNVF